MTVEPRPYTCDAQADVYLLLNVPHLVQQMVHAVLWSSGRKWVGFFGLFCVLFIGYLAFFLSCLINPHPCRLSPAASAPASSSPAALLPTRPLLAKRWRFTVCWSWISTPLKVRQWDVHFYLISPRQHFWWWNTALSWENNQVIAKKTLLQQHPSITPVLKCRLYSTRGVSLSFVLM